MSGAAALPAPVRPALRHRRAEALSVLFVETQRVKRAFERMDELLVRGWEEHFCRALLLLGPSRAGKTHIVTNYVRTRSEGEGAPRIVSVEVPAGCTLKTFATDLLGALDDPDPEYGSQAEKTRRIIEGVRESKVDLLVIDEVQRLIDADTDKVKRDVANWLTALLNRRVCPLLLVGERTAERVFQGNMHLMGRTLGQVPVDAYDWADPADRQEWQLVLHLLDQNLSMEERGRLGEPDTALRVHAFAGGLLGQAATLLDQARSIARRAGRPCLTRDILAQAVDELRIGTGRRQENPFRVDAPVALPLAAVVEEQPRRPRARPPRRNGDAV